MSFINGELTNGEFNRFVKGIDPNAKPADVIDWLQDTVMKRFNGDFNIAVRKLHKIITEQPAKGNIMDLEEITREKPSLGVALASIQYDYPKPSAKPA